MSTIVKAKVKSTCVDPHKLALDYFVFGDDILNGTTLVVGLLTGAIGLAYFVYGKNTTKLWFVASGILLVAYPYFVHNQIVLVIVGILLLVCPFLAS